MDSALAISFGIITIILLTGFIFSIKLGIKQKKYGKVSSTRVKYPVLSNPVIWSYVLFALIVLSFAYYFSIYYGTY